MSGDWNERGKRDFIHEEARLAHQQHRDRLAQNEKTANELAVVAVRSLLLINCGVCVSMLAFLSAANTVPMPMMLYMGTIIVALKWFGSGVFAAALSIVCAYLYTYFLGHRLGRFGFTYDVDGFVRDQEDKWIVFRKISWCKVLCFSFFRWNCRWLYISRAIWSWIERIGFEPHCIDAILDTREAGCPGLKLR